MSLGVQGIKSVFQHPDLGLFIIRVVLGVVLVMAGWIKFAGGQELLHMVGANIHYIGIQPGSHNALTLFFGIMSAGTELVGGGLLVLGVLFRISSALLAFNMLVATLSLCQSFSGDFSKYSYPLVLMVVLVGLLFTGPGKLSLQKD